MNFKLLTSLSILTLLVGSIASIIICSMIIYYGQKYKLFSKTSFRRPENEMVPLLGGLAIVCAFLATNFFLQNLFSWKLLAALIPLIVFGSWDDLKEAPARLKIAVQFFSALMLISLIGPSDVLYARLGFGPIWGSLISILFLITITNAYNFMDGIDGQTSVIAISALFALGYSHNQVLPTSIALIAGTIGFFLLNFPPAKIYLGEIGSSVLGFCTAGMALTLPVNSSYQVAFWGVNFIFALPMCDLITAVVRRLKNGLAPWSPDRDHFHHKLLSIGLSNRSVLFVTSFISVITSVVGAQLLRATNIRGVIVLGAVSAATLSFIYFGIYIAEKLWGLKISTFGRQLILKYIPIDDSKIILNRKDKCVLIDLLPYFSELQIRGINVVEKFSEDLGDWAMHLENAKSFRLVGSYSVAIILNRANTIDWKKNISKQLHNLLLKHRAMRYYKTYPDGVYFYDNLNDPYIRHLLAIDEIDPIKKVS